ncbi:type II toxin-antitoxin system RelE family toxin [Candidatus Pyrohabitans sp.]
MYKVVVHKKVAKKLKSLKNPYLNKFSEFVGILEENPVPWRMFDIKKIEGTENTYRVRFGDYRVVYYIDKASKTIHILKFERRGRIY